MRPGNASAIKSRRSIALPSLPKRSMNTDYAMVAVVTCREADSALRHGSVGAKRFLRWLLGRGSFR